MDAKTIHRLLEYKPGENFWGKNDLAEEADVSTISRNFFARTARNPLEVRHVFWWRMICLKTPLEVICMSVYNELLAKSCVIAPCEQRDRRTRILSVLPF
jgi:hypothetical protein